MRKNLYIERSRETYLPIQFQPWWLDAVCKPEHWGACVATDSGGAPTGLLPYFLRKRWGMTIIALPPLTSYAGPWFLYPDNPDFKRHSRYTFEKAVGETLIEQLPKTAFFFQHFHPNIQNWYPFYTKGFRQTTRYTYCFDPIGDLQACFDAFKSGVRANLKKMEKTVVVQRADARAGVVFDLHGATLRGKGLRPPCPTEVFERLHHALQLRGQSACFLALDRQDGTPHAGIYLVFDQRTASILISGLAERFKGSCAMYGLIWEAIQFAAQRGLSLDFEGSMDPGVEHLFRGFGAVMTPYFSVWKAGNKCLELAYGAYRIKNG